MKSKNLKLYLLIFKTAFSISSFTFGGGYVAISMVRKYFVHDLKLISEEELLDMAAIAQSTPGAIAVNIAVLVGYRLAGITGAIISGVGTVLPPLLILSVISAFYQSFRDNRIISAILKGMEAGVVAIIVSLLVDMVQGILKEKNWLLTLITPAAFLANFVFNANVVVIILVCSILCFAQTYMKEKNITSRKGGNQDE